MGRGREERARRTGLWREVYAAVVLELLLPFHHDRFMIMSLISQIFCETERCVGGGRVGEIGGDRGKGRGREEGRGKGVRRRGG